MIKIAFQGYIEKSYVCVSKRKQVTSSQIPFYLPIKLTKNTIIEEVEKQEYVCVYTHTHVTM